MGCASQVPVPGGASANASAVRASQITILRGTKSNSSSALNGRVSEWERHACGAFIHHATRVSIAVRINSPPLAGLAPNTLPAMATDFDFESSDILGGALPVGRGRVAQNSGFSSFFKICALGASTLVLLLAFRHGRTFFLRWKERHYKLYALFHSYLTSGLTQIVICKGLCVDDTESRTMISDPSMSLMLPLDSPRRIRGKYRIDCEMCRQSTS
jgi:hypothetical protein